MHQAQGVALACSHCGSNMAQQKHCGDDMFKEKQKCTSARD
jgi:hypothetical protein